MSYNVLRLYQHVQKWHPFGYVGVDVSFQYKSAQNVMKEIIKCQIVS